MDKEGVLAIDDTGALKPFAKKTEGVAYQYYSTLKQQAYCNVAVASCFVNASKHIPLNFKFYKVQDEFRLGKYAEAFRSKIDFARELFNEAVEQSIPFSYVVFDSWYSSSELLEHIHANKRCFINEIKSVRRFSFKHPVSIRIVWLQEGELVKLIRKYFWDKTKLVRYGNAILPVYCFRTRLKGCSVPLTAFVVFNKLYEDDTRSVHILISNDWRLSEKRAVSSYMLRWGIEKMFRELKDSLYFDHYQVRCKEKIMRHWMLCALVFSLILWVKLNGCLTKMLNYSPQSFNGYKQALNKLILFTSYAYLSKNAQEADCYFADIKSQRFKDKFLYH